MTAKRFHHVGILVESFADIQYVFAGCLGLEIGIPEPEPELGIEILWVDAAGVALELIRPTDPGSRAAVALRSGGGGVHHVAFQVDDVDASLSAFRAMSVATLDEHARAGARGSRIAFLDPASVAETRVELVEDGMSRLCVTDLGNDRT